MSIVKKFFPKKGICKVVFSLPESVTNQANQVAIVGDFNAWHPEKNLMSKDKNGKFKATIEFQLGREYQFRYLIDHYRWETDWDADDLCKTPYEETYNSVIRCDEIELKA